MASFEKLKSLTDKHLNELVLTDSNEVVKLLGIINEDTDPDIYWKYCTMDRGVIYSTCVGGWTPLKGVIPEDEYKRRHDRWNLKCKLHRKLDPKWNEYCLKCKQ